MTPAEKFQVKGWRKIHRDELDRIYIDTAMNERIRKILIKRLNDKKNGYK